MRSDDPALMLLCRERHEPNARLNPLPVISAVSLAVLAPAMWWISSFMQDDQNVAIAQTVILFCVFLAPFCALLSFWDFQRVRRLRRERATDPGLHLEPIPGLRWSSPWPGILALHWDTGDLVLTVRLTRARQSEEAVVVGGNRVIDVAAADLEGWSALIVRSCNAMAQATRSMTRIPSQMPDGKDLEFSTRDEFAIVNRLRFWMEGETGEHRLMAPVAASWLAADLNRVMAERGRQAMARRAREEQVRREMERQALPHLLPASQRARLQQW